MSRWNCHPRQTCADGRAAIQTFCSLGCATSVLSSVKWKQPCLHQVISGNSKGNKFPRQLMQPLSPGRHAQTVHSISQVPQDCTLTYSANLPTPLSLTLITIFKSVSVLKLCVCMFVCVDGYMHVSAGALGSQRCQIPRSWSYRQL